MSCHVYTYTEIGKDVHGESDMYRVKYILNTIFSVDVNMYSDVVTSY